MSPAGQDTADDRPWPAVIDAAVAANELLGAGPVVRVEPGTWALERAMVHHLPPQRAASLVAVLDRLAGRAPFAVPEVVMAAGGWVVTRTPAGERADRPERHADPDDLVCAVGAGLRSLHDLPVGELARHEGASPGSGWDAVAERCRAAVAGGRVDRSRLPAPYDRYPPDRLLELFLDGRPAIDDDVLCHGRATMEAFLVDHGRFSGFARLDVALVADRHLDLATAHRSAQAVFGPEAVFRLYDAYGADPDLVRLDHYVLAGHLLGSGATSGPVEAAEPGA